MLHVVNLLETVELRSYIEKQWKKNKEMCVGKNLHFVVWRYGIAKYVFVNTRISVYHFVHGFTSKEHFFLV